MKGLTTHIIRVQQLRQEGFYVDALEAELAMFHALAKEAAELNVNYIDHPMPAQVAEFLNQQHRIRRELVTVADVKNRPYG